MFCFSHKHVFFGSDLVKYCLYSSFSSYRRCSRPLHLLGRLLLECVYLLVVLVVLIGIVWVILVISLPHIYFLLYLYVRKTTVNNSFVIKHIKNC